jgi:hypothetical protein
MFIVNLAPGGKNVLLSFWSLAASSYKLATPLGSILE